MRRPTPAQRRLLDLLASRGGEDEFWPLVNDWMHNSARELSQHNVNRTIDALLRDGRIRITDAGYIQSIDP